MVFKSLFLVALVACPTYLNLAVCDKPVVVGSFSGPGNDCENKVPNQCEQTGNSPGPGDLCTPWTTWKLNEAQNCENPPPAGLGGSVCSLSLQPDKGAPFFASRPVLCPTCPGGSVCMPTTISDYCASNPGAFICLSGAFTGKCTLGSIGRCIEDVITTTFQAGK